MSGHALGETYVCALSVTDRIAHGRHYTPRLLADALWREVERSGVWWQASTVTDPAAGAGALLLRPLRERVSHGLDRDPAEALSRISEQISGVDADPLAVWLGNAILAAELLPLWARLPERARRPLPRLLRTGDGLDVADESAGVVVMNPPFGRAALDTAERERWQRSLYGHANWYGVFLHAAVERAESGGLVAAVLPTSFLGGAYYQRLRKLLAEQAPLIRLRLVEDRSGVFASRVLQETCLAIFEKGGRPRKVACSKQSVNGRVSSVNLGRLPLAPASPDLPWLLPRTSGDRALVSAAAKHRRRLSDFGWKASTGPLVWNRHKSQIGSERAAHMLPILWAADIEAGAVRRSRARDGQRWIALRDRDMFMRLSEPAVLVQRTTAPEQPRRLVAAALTREQLVSEWGGAVVVENHVNLLRCSSETSPLSPGLLARLLNSPTLDRLYRCITGTVAVSAYELEALPLPEAEMLLGWRDLRDDDLFAAVAEAYSE